MRLIDADWIVDSDIANCLGAEYCSCVPDVRDMLNDQPTAYDLDGVLNQLEEELRMADEEKRRCAGQNPLQFDSAKGYANGIANAIDYVKGGIIPGEKTRTTPWIMCSERLPENDMEEVLVWFEYFRYGEYNCLYRTIGTSHTYRGGWSGFVNGTSGWRDLRVIAWMPLPKPPEEDAQDD